MVAALRAFRDAHPPLRFVTSFALVGDRCITVLDTGETESDVSHCGDPWLAEDELARVLADEKPLANVLNADDFGVWVSGIAPVRDDAGAIVAAVTVDAPVARVARPRPAGRPLAHPGGDAAGGRHPLQPGRGRGDHRRPHRPLQPPLPARAPRGGARARPASRDARSRCCSSTATSSRPTTTPTATRPETPPWRASPASSSPAAGRVDLAARYGGEEFVLVLVETDAAGALTVAERIRAEVAASSAAQRTSAERQHRRRHLPRRRRGPRRAPRQGRLGDVCGQARRARPRAGFLRWPGPKETWLSRRGR